MHAVINLLFKCNLECEYCYLQAGDTKSIINSHKWTEKTPNEWIEGLFWMGEKFSTVTNLDISGGEPFLYSRLTDLINKIPLDIYIGLTTNATYIPDRFFYIKDERRRRMHMTVSLHLDSNGNIRDKFLDNVKKLKENGFQFCVNFVAYEKQSHKIKELKNLFAGLGIEFHVEPYIDYNNPQKKLGYMSDEIFNELDKNTRTSLTRIKNREIPSYCNIGTNYVWITPDGFIYQCMGKLFNKDDPIGNIFYKEIYKIPESPQLCDIFCPCSQNW